MPDPKPKPKPKRINARKELNSDEWEKMPLHELYHQQGLLQQKLDVAQNMGNIPMATQLQRGLATLQLYIIHLQIDDPDPTTTVIMR